MLSCTLSKENVSVNIAKEADGSGEKRARINHRVGIYGRNDGGVWTGGHLGADGGVKA